MNDNGTIYGMVKGALEYECPFTLYDRPAKWRKELDADIERVADILEPLGTIKPLERRYYIVSEIIRYYKLYIRRCVIGGRYWPTVQRYAKYKQLEKALTDYSPTITIKTKGTTRTVQQWQLSYYDTAGKHHTHTEKTGKYKKPNIYYIGPEKINEWPGVGCKRRYTPGNKDYSVVRDELFCNIGGLLGALRFGCPIPQGKETFNLNGVADKCRTLYDWLRLNAPDIMTPGEAKEFVLKLAGLEQHQVERERLQARVSKGSPKSPER